MHYCLKTQPQFGEPKQFTRKQFLSHPVLLAKDHKMSIGDVISFNSHIAGAVHTSEPRFEKDRTLADVVKRFPLPVDGPPYDLAVRQLLPISEIVDSALDELFETVISDIGATRAA